MDPASAVKTSEVLAVSTAPHPTNVVLTATQVGGSWTVELNGDVRFMCDLSPVHPQRAPASTDSVTTGPTQMGDVNRTPVSRVSLGSSASGRRLPAAPWPSFATPTLTVTSVMDHPGEFSQEVLPPVNYIPSVRTKQFPVGVLPETRGVQTFSKLGQNCIKRLAGQKNLKNQKIKKM